MVKKNTNYIVISKENNYIIVFIRISQKAVECGVIIYLARFSPSL